MSFRPPRPQVVAKESLIAANLTIEGKIVGSGHVRLAGRFKGDVQVDGNLTIDSGAVVDGAVRGTDGNDAFTVAGTIDGAGTFDLGLGDDTLTLEDGADTSGFAAALRGGTGNDALVASIAGSATLGATNG